MAPIDALLAILTRQSPYVMAEIGCGKLHFVWLGTDRVYDEPPVIAIEEREGRKIVSAVGRSAEGMAGQSNVTVHHVFQSLEPLLQNYEVECAIVQHALREVFRVRSFFSPRVALRLVGRSSPLSEQDECLLARFARDCGVAVLYVFLGYDEVPKAFRPTHKILARAANRVIHPANAR